MATALRADSLSLRAAASLPSMPRQAWMDNLRVAVIAGVIVTQVAATYAVSMPSEFALRRSGRMGRPTTLRGKPLTS